MVLYKEDWEKELKANEGARDAHFMGYEICKNICEHYEVMIANSEPKPVEKRIIYLNLFYLFIFSIR